TSSTPTCSPSSAADAQRSRLRPAFARDATQDQQPAVPFPPASNSIVLPESGTCTGTLDALVNASVLLPARTLPFSVPASFACDAMTDAGLTSSLITYAASAGPV